MSENVARAPSIKSGAKTIRGSKGKSKIPTRSSLSSPYTCGWPRLRGGLTPSILAEIKRTFEPLQGILGKRKSKNRKQTEKKREAEKTSGKSEEEKQRLVLRSQLALGINEVTRALEKGQLDLLMVCRTAKPGLMTSHLIALSATRDCSAVAVFRLSETLGPLLNMKTVLAIGFKKATEVADCTDFAELVSFVREKCPPINIPWLKFMDLPPEELVEIVGKDLYQSHWRGQEPPAVKKQQNQESVSPHSSVDVIDSASKSNSANDESIINVTDDSIVENSSARDAGNNSAVSDRLSEAVTQQGTGEMHGAETAVPGEGREMCEGIEIGEGGEMCEGTEHTQALDERVGTQSHNAEEGPILGQTEATKKRKLGEISPSPEKGVDGNKRKKFLKMPFSQTTVKHVKIISKLEKGKKKKKKNAKKK